KSRKRRWIALSQIGEDHPEVLLGGVAGDPHLGGEAGVLGGLLAALAGAIVLPPAVEAAEAVALHPAGAELRAAVGTTVADQVGRAILATVERELLVEDAPRYRLASVNVMRVSNRLPEAPQVPASKRARSRPYEIMVIDVRH